MKNPPNRGDFSSAQDWIRTYPGYQYFINAACQKCVRTFEEAQRRANSSSFHSLSTCHFKDNKKDIQYKLNL